MKTLLISQSFIVDFDDSTLQNKLQDFFEIISQNMNEHDIQIDKDHIAKLCNSSISVLDPNHFNCCKCSICGSWVTDCKKDKPFFGLSRGTEVEGCYFCDQCLDDQIHIGKISPIPYSERGSFLLGT